MTTEEFTVEFDGVALIDEAGDMVVLCHFDEMVEAGLGKALAEELAKKPGACRPKRQKGQFDCTKRGCTGTCHVFSAPKGPGPKTETDEGLGPVPMSRNRFYWCRCV